MKWHYFTPNELLCAWNISKTVFLSPVASTPLRGPLPVVFQWPRSGTSWTGSARCCQTADGRTSWENSALQCSRHLMETRYWGWWDSVQKSESPVDGISQYPNIGRLSTKVIPLFFLGFNQGACCSGLQQTIPSGKILLQNSNKCWSWMGIKRSWGHRFKISNHQSITNQFWSSARTNWCSWKRPYIYKAIYQKDRNPLHAGFHKWDFPHFKSILMVFSRIWTNHF